MAVDWLRSCYTGSMRFWPDRPDLTVKVRWFFTDQPFVPYTHVFGSTNWINDEDSADNGVGECIDLPRTWNNGSAPGQYPGILPCGSASAWLNGVPFPSPAPPPVPDFSPPACCTTIPFCSVRVWKILASGFTGACSGFNGTFSVAVNDDRPCFWDNGFQLPYWQMLGDPAFNTLSVTACADLDCSGFFANYSPGPIMANVTLGVPIILGHPTGSSNCPGFPLSITVIPLY